MHHSPHQVKQISLAKRSGWSRHQQVRSYPHLFWFWKYKFCRICPHKIYRPGHIHHGLNQVGRFDLSLGGTDCPSLGVQVGQYIRWVSRHEDELVSYNAVHMITGPTWCGYRATYNMGSTKFEGLTTPYVDRLSRPEAIKKSGGQHTHGWMMSEP